MYQRRDYNEADKALSKNIRAQLEAVEALLMQLPPSRNRSLALAHLEDTMLRANLAITEAIALREEA